MTNLRRERKKDNLKVNLIFAVNILNIEDLPNFARLASRLGADKIICRYNYISVPEQKHLSCFFKQDLTNCVFDKVEAIAKNLNVKIEFPPRFGLSEYPKPKICQEPWTRIILNAQGRVLSCDSSIDCNLTFDHSKNFLRDIWNSEYYQKLRISLIERTADCHKYCFRVNPVAVNDCKSHVIC